MIQLATMLTEDRNKSASKFYLCDKFRGTEIIKLKPTGLLFLQIYNLKMI